MDVPILWKSKQQKSVALSSSESEYYALSEAAKDIKFVVQIITSMGGQVETPIIVRVDNVGAIFMAEHSSATPRTKHIDMRYHFVREFVVDKFIKIVFIKSADNLADSFTKNVTIPIYENHSKEMIAPKPK